MEDFKVIEVQKTEDTASCHICHAANFVSAITERTESIYKIQIWNKQRHGQSMSLCKKHLDALRIAIVECEDNEIREMYKIGEPVYFCLTGTWYEAEIVNGYRTEDGMINVRLKDGRTAWCSEAQHRDFLRPALLYEQEL